MDSHFQFPDDYGTLRRFPAAGGGTETMWSLVAFISVVVIVAGIIGVIRPMAAVYLPTRTRAVLAVLLGLVLLSTAGGQIQEPRNVFEPGDSTAEPDEPCRVEASDAAARTAAQNWCQEGIFTLVKVSNSGNTFVAILQFSKRGQVGWTNNKFAVLNQFRQVTDEMVEKADLNVAFSLHGTDGQMVGGCARKRGARESTCN